MGKASIICVDDDRLVLVGLRDQLSQVIGYDYELELAETGEETLEIFEERLADGEQIPLIICDQNLPDILGSELLSKIHQVSPNTRKVLLTGGTQADAIIQAINSASLYRYIPKPWDAADLILTVKEALRSYSQDLQLIEQNRQLRRVNQLLQREIEERELAQARLLHDALHDALTGLPNRTLLMERINQALKRRRHERDQFLAVLFVDLDRFKSVNDSLGHPIGDQLLLQITHLLEQCVREGDTVARWGGDEFIILVDGICTTQAAVTVAERILDKLKAPIILGEHTVFSGASIGIAVTDGKTMDGGKLLRDADIAMYQAKTLGKARYVMFDPAMYTQTMELLETEHDLRLAVAREEFILYYQPIVCLKTGEMTNVEALIRWQHPTRGLVTPNHFIPIAEETGLIVPMGAWVLKKACQHLSELRRLYPTADDLKVSINLATKQLQEGDFILQLDQILQETEVTGASLRLEITESMLMDSSETMLEVLKQLRDRHIELSLDDFGTGYSSLNYLPRLPLDTLKIDQSFIRAMASETEDLEIVRTIITLAHTLNMNVIAEGIETSSHVRQLLALKCDLGQGYFFSKPMSFEDLSKLYAQGAELDSISSFRVPSFLQIA